MNVKLKLIIHNSKPFHSSGRINLLCESKSHVTPVESVAAAAGHMLHTKDSVVYHTSFNMKTDHTQVAGAPAGFLARVGKHLIDKIWCKALKKFSRLLTLPYVTVAHCIH